MTLTTLARVIAEFASELTACDQCDGMFDADFTRMWFGDEVTICEFCSEENRRSWNEDLYDLD